MAVSADSAANSPRRVLVLGGVDPSGGAGITLDALVVAAHGAHALPIVLALTAQNRRGFRGSDPIAPARWRAALDAVLDDGPVHAIKVGLAGDAANVRAVGGAVAALARDVPVVVDPVLSATAGGYAAAADLVAAYRECLAPRAALLTPNTPELAALFGGDRRGALAAGVRAVLHKGGHDDGPECVDVLATAAGERAFARPRLACGRVRGTGCALAASIAARLAGGADLAAACAGAGDWLAGLLRDLGPAPADGLPRLLPLAGLRPPA